MDASMFSKVFKTKKALKNDTIFINSQQIWTKYNITIRPLVINHLASVTK